MARAVVDAMPDAVLVVDAADVITLANHQIESQFGYTRDQLIGQSIEHPPAGVDPGGARSTGRGTGDAGRSPMEPAASCAAAVGMG